MGCSNEGARRTRAGWGISWILGVVASVGLLFAPGMAGASGVTFMSTKGNVAAPSGARSLCSIYDWACASSARSDTVTEEQMRIVRAVNKRINRAIKPIDDVRQYGEEDRWVVPTQQGGDCEDFVLAKKRDLILAGIAPQRLLIATVLDRKRNPHAVLVFRTDNGDLILDNLTDRIQSWQATRYVFLRMQDPRKPSNWVNVHLGG